MYKALAYFQSSNGGLGFSMLERTTAHTWEGFEKTPSVNTFYVAKLRLE